MEDRMHEAKRNMGERQRALLAKMGGILDDRTEVRK
jgi:hypothetical protein